MGLTPQWRIEANSQDLGQAARDRFVSMRITDDAGIQSDKLELTLADHEPERPIAVPATGAELGAWMGYDDAMTYMGLFVVDEVELSGPPQLITIRAHAATHDKTPEGKTRLNTQRTRSWDNVTLGDMVRVIAGEHRLTPAVADKLASMALGHVDQTDESDMHLLTRLAQQYGAVAKPAGGYLVVAKRGVGKTASGKAMPAATVGLEEITSWRMRIETRDAGGTVTARWHDRAAGEEKEVSAGSGEPARRLRNPYPSEAEAQAAADAEAGKRARGKRHLSLTLPGRADLLAEAPLRLRGFRSGLGGDWIMTRVEHSLDSSGYVCSVTAEAA